MMVDFVLVLARVEATTSWPEMGRSNEEKIER
jgi:hypothetical protein